MIQVKLLKSHLAKIMKIDQKRRKGLQIFDTYMVKKVINREMTSWPLKIALKVPKNAWATEDTNSVIFVQKSFNRCAWIGNLIILKNFSFLSSLKGRWRRQKMALFVFESWIQLSATSTVKLSFLYLITFFNVLWITQTW